MFFPLVNVKLKKYVFNTNTLSKNYKIPVFEVWCGKYRPEVLKLRIMTGSHSPAPYRVIGPLANTPEFAREFGCPLGSPMNPVKKCSV
ncbi:Neprilysin-2, partial [Araneus ventricosus]